MKTLKQISSFAPSGSAIVFDYMVHPSTQSILRRLVFHLLARRLSCLGEPWVCFLEPNKLTTALKANGFTQAVNIAPEEINVRFFNDRADNLKVGNFGN